MKTFQDLKFKSHPNWNGAAQARMDFPNEYSISVITGENAYSDKENPYECAVMLNGSCCYTTHITDDTVGYCTADKVTEIMKQIQELKE